MKTLKLTESNDKQYTLVAIIYPNDVIKEYAVVHGYNPNVRFGKQWAHGSYFFSLEDALSHLRTKEGKVSIYQLEEISSHALHYIEDVHDEFEEFTQNYDLELSASELLFFGLDRYL